MEKTVDKKWFMIIGLAVIALCGIYIISTVSFISDLSVQAGRAVTAGDYLQQFFETGGLFLFLFTALIIVTVFVQAAREVIAKVLIWGLLLLSVIMNAAFFTSIYNISQYPDQISYYIIASIPLFCAIVPLVALICQWDSAKKKATRVICIVSAIIAAVFVILQLTQYNPSALGSVLLFLVLLTFNVGVVLVPLFVLSVTKNRQAFYVLMCGLTEEEAVLVEKIEDKIGEVKEELEECAILKLERELEDELEERSLEMFEDELEEAETELEEELAQAGQAMADAAEEEKTEE